MKIFLFLLCIAFSLPAPAQDSIPVTIKGKLNADINDETSGIAASSINKGLLYIHNDSGDTSRFFLIGTDGVLKAIYTFKANPLIKNGVTDCEDIAVGRGPKGKPYVYIGDIGDNNAKRKYITVYRIKEPKLKSSAKIFTGYANADPLYLKYPDGARDAETLMVDPVEKLFYIISKREDSVSVYTAPLLFKRNDTVILTKRATLFFEGGNSGKWISGGDISANGSQVLVKSYLKVYYWKRRAKEPVWQLLMTPPREMPYKAEQQGEAIGFTMEGKGYYTISEGMHPEVYYYGIE
ncbi:hypothetical protein [Agriterribacter sp.]|uniref:hypothetical protein n=1 Tax=Agriterribacter sp. TaxID=2821509 RepID=UPI002C2AA4D1|nr:hypothetical protein [Agriterribacter sp.]HTN06963.1 hypothetical protein [Agriterribacter sp.]